MKSLSFLSKRAGSSVTVNISVQKKLGHAVYCIKPDENAILVLYQGI